MPVLGSSSPIKSIQRGTAFGSGSGNVTINAVDLDKSFVSSSFQSGFYTTNVAGNGISAAASLTTTTNLAIHLGYSVGYSGYPRLYWEVIEYV